MVYVYVRALLRTGNTTLLACRQNLSFGDGMYSMVGGKVAGGNTARQTIRQEVREEAGLDIHEEDFSLVHSLHRKSDDIEIVILCCTAYIRTMSAPYNSEPSKHRNICFFPIEQLPTNILPAHEQIIQCVIQEIPYSEHGW